MNAETYNRILVKLQEFVRSWHDNLHQTESERLIDKNAVIDKIETLKCKNVEPRPIVDFPNGFYTVGTPEADMIGFTADLYWGNFSREDNKLFFQYVGSLHRNEGNVQRLYKSLIDGGWDLYIVRPNEIMQHICIKFGLTLETSRHVMGRFTEYYNEPCWSKP